MSRLTVYVPDDLAEWARSANVNVSRITQEALRSERRRADHDTWLDDVRRRPSRRLASQRTSMWCAKLQGELADA